MTQIQDHLNPLPRELISPRLNKYLNQIDRLNIAQLIQFDEEEEENAQMQRITPINYYLN